MSTNGITNTVPVKSKYSIPTSYTVNLITKIGKNQIWSAASARELWKQISIGEVIQMKVG